MEDRRVYLAQVQEHYLQYDVNSYNGALSYVTGEYFWGWLLDLLMRRLSLPPDLALGAISLFAVYTACLAILRVAPMIYVAMLLNPIFIDLVFSQLRIALAMGLATAAFLISAGTAIGRVARVSLLILSCLVHTSMVLLVMLFILGRALAAPGRRLRPPARLLIAIAIGITIAIFLGPQRMGILDALGDRRTFAEYSSSSPKYYLFWLGLAIALILEWGAAKASFVRTLSISALTVALVGVPMGVYSNRVLAAFLPFLVASIATFSRNMRHVVVVAYVAYVLMFWFYWLRLV